jgi:hypothetical protein
LETARPTVLPALVSVSDTATSPVALLPGDARSAFEQLQANITGKTLCFIIFRI